jgi:hypothetical protein
VNESYGLLLVGLNGEKVALKWIQGLPNEIGPQAPLSVCITMVSHRTSFQITIGSRTPCTFTPQFSNPKITWTNGEIACVAVHFLDAQAVRLTFFQPQGNLTQINYTDTAIILQFKSGSRQVVQAFAEMLPAMERLPGRRSRMI